MRRQPRCTVFPYTTLFRSATWLLRNEQDAEDVVQEAYLRAFKSFSGFRGSNGRPWLRSEEHTSELQSHVNLVCRLLLENKTAIACPDFPTCQCPFWPAMAF